MTGSARRDPLWAVLACLAAAVPTFLAFGTDPAPSFFNELAAVIGWGAFLLVLAASVPRHIVRRSAGSVAFLAALVLLLIADLASPVLTGAPWSMPLASAGVLASAILTVAVATALARVGFAAPGFRALCIGLLVAGVVSSLIGLAQVFMPLSLDNWWVARSVLPGRATGNLRQPNHLCLLLLWAMVASIWLGQARVIGTRASAAFTVLLLYVVVLTASRTAVLAMLALTAWGFLDRTLTRRARVSLMLAPVAYAAMWAGTAFWASRSGSAFGGLSRLNSHGDFTGVRLGIWKNALSLLAAHPWLGLGFGGFNFAWTLTPFPGRYSKGFDNTHNLPINFVVELGVPLGFLVLALIAFALVRQWRNAALPLDDARTNGQRAGFMIVVLAGLYSLVEFPLWYSYFLLPVAFVVGLGLERRQAEEAALTAAPDTNVARPMVFAAVAMLFAGAFAYADFHRVLVIFQPASSARILEQRISAGRNSLLFGQYADYAAATASARPAAVMDAFPRATHQLLDPPLMAAWAVALNERGEVDKARYIARRLKEFTAVDSTAFFAPCGAPSGVGGAAGSDRAPPQPFQCLEPSHPLHYEDFR